MHLDHERRLLAKLVREITRAETQAIEHAPREAKRLGEVPPVLALRDVANHSTSMRPRLLGMLEAYDLRIGRRGLGATLATLRHLVVDHAVDPERSFRTALLDLRHGLDVAQLLRDTARRELMFGVIRWCDDWLGTRRTLVAHAAAQLAWFVEQASLAVEALPFSDTASAEDLDDWHADRTT